MAWYGIVLCFLAGVAGLYFLLCIVIAVVAPNVFTKPKGINRLTFEQVRAIQTKFGNDGFAAYDAMQKEPFLLHGDNADIACEFLPAEMPAPEGQRPKCLIRVHGFSQNHLTSVRFLRMFRELGYANVIYDQRGFGDSTGFCSLGYFEKFDLEAIVKWVKNRMGEDTVIGLHGESLGAITALCALTVCDQIDFVVADSSGTSVYGMFSALTHLPAAPLLFLAELRVRIQYHSSIKKIRPIDGAANAEIPILFLHGTKDEQIKFSDGVKLKEVARHPLSRFEVFEGMRHCEAHGRETERYERVVQEFVRDVEKTLESVSALKG